MSLVRLDNIEYETHYAHVTLPSGVEVTIPIDCNKSRYGNNAEIEEWFKQLYKAGGSLQNHLRKKKEQHDKPTRNEK
jgi:hypothetical protein